ncbi:MAG TPA: thermonuclease family protein [Coriobacteriia bacterium]|nr:thermonuclease family protein [Coriobacteriia bacterium]
MVSYNAIHEGKWDSFMPLASRLTLLTRMLVCAALLFGALLVGCTTAQTSSETQGTAPDARAVVPESPEGLQPDSPAPESDPEPEPKPEALRGLRAAVVVRVVDGDTAHLRLTKSGKVEKVRFIGVDTPESTTKHEPYGAEASAYTKKKLPVGRTVYLERDAELRDRYGRMLAYVWLSEPVEVDSDGRATYTQARLRMLNARLMRDGFAQVMTIPPNVRYQDYFLKLQRQARDGGRGLWAKSAADAEQDAAPPAPATGGGAKSAGAYIGNRNTMRFHIPSCASVNQMNPANKVPLSSRSAAIDGGYVPCGNCRP